MTTLSHNRARQALESAQRDAATQHYVLTLFVAGTTPNSLIAIANTRRMCQRYLADRHTLTIVDLYQQPELAEAEQIIAVPTLLRRSPYPVKRLIGNMANVALILLPISLIDPPEALATP